MDTTADLTLSEISNKYFYRTEKWDWLNDTMIHVYDSKRPRMITMDPWPQEVFLDATGQKTIKDYIQDFALQYKPGEVPPELDKQIVDVLSGLVVDEKIVRLSDTPVTLEDAILKPLRDFGKVDLHGTWTGTYTYNIPKQYKDDRLQQVAFTIKITNVDGLRFSGTVEDNQETGGTPGSGKIDGRFDEYKISFDKRMPVYTHVDTNRNHITDNSKQHPTIVYEGEFAPGKQFISGTWRFKKKKLIWKGIFPFWVSGGHGEFTMTKGDGARPTG